MDNNAILRILPKMKSWLTAPHIEHFNNALWARTPAERSSSCTPLYAERFKGIHNSKRSTAHDFWEFTGVVSGKGYLYANEKSLMDIDAIILVPPGINHHEHTEQELDTIWLGFRAELPSVNRKTIYKIHSPVFLKKLVEFWSFSSRNFTMTGIELDGMLRTLIGLFFRELNDRRRPFQDTAQQAVQIMNDHSHEIISIDALAKNLRCSKRHFFRTFKDFTGQTPVAYLNSTRIKQAALYLTKTNLPVNQIAKLCGFDDPYYFSRTFHKINGQSPKNYREMITAD